MSKNTFDLTGKELFHYGILGQKWGIRKYQNPDGTYTEEGKARYFGKPGGAIDRFKKGIGNTLGFRKDDSKLDKVGKVALGLVTGGLTNMISGAEKNRDNAKKLGIKTNTGKEFVKAILMGGNQATTNYNIHRKEGSGRVKSILQTWGDGYLDIATLGKHSYKMNEKYGLEHSDNN